MNFSRITFLENDYGISPALEENVVTPLFFENEILVLSRGKRGPPWTENV